MFEVTFFDMDDGNIRKAFVQSLEDVIRILRVFKIDFVEHFVKVRYVEK